MSDLVMPAEYFGETKRSGGYTKSEPREWTKPELEWVLAKISEGYTSKDIAEAIGRTQVSVSIKVKRSKKRDNTYNEKHRAMKYQANHLFINEICPETVLDVYAGNSFYLDKDIPLVTDNDKDPKFPTLWNMDALDLMCYQYLDGKKYDLIDLDPYGSAYECFDLAMKMATKGLVISFGEWGHLRWRRFDFVRPRYGIKDVDQFTPENFIQEIERIATINKKKVKVYNQLQYANFLRVYFTIEPLKITEQWDD